MIYRTIQLRTMIEKVGRKETKDFLSDFSCPLNKDVEYFVKNKAIPFELAGKSYTYLIFAQDGEEIYGLCAIYAIAPQSLLIDRKLSASQRKKYFGTTYSLGNSINALLIGQLSKNYANNLNKYISGELLMSLIFERIKLINKLVATTSVYVECENVEYLKVYYKKYGFEYFITKEDGLLMYLIPTRILVKSEYKK